MHRQQQATLARGWVGPIAALVMVSFFMILMWKSSDTSSTRTPSPITLVASQVLKENRSIGYEYASSQMEAAWLPNANAWTSQSVHCDHVASSKAEIDYWISVTSGQEKLNAPVATPALNTSVFSSFKHKYLCDGQEKVLTSYIEPISFGLRHPSAFCNGDATSKAYLLLASSVELHTRTCGTPKGRTFLFDLGASTWTDGIGGVSHSWFINRYAKLGITFERILMWEATVHRGDEIFASVPKDVISAYQYINLPCTANRSDPSNPLNIIKKITTPEDFVVLKLDIDNTPVEMELIKYLEADPEIYNRVDEFFFENHVEFFGMSQWWGKIPEGYDMDSSFNLFVRLRKLGIRAHSWI